MPFNTVAQNLKFKNGCVLIHNFKFSIEIQYIM